MISAGIPVLFAFKGEYMDVSSPIDGVILGKVAVSNAADVEAAVARAQARTAPVFVRSRTIFTL